MLFSLFKHYLDLYVTDTALKVSRSLYCFTPFVYLMVLKTISQGCGVRASPVLFCNIVIVSTGSIRWILWFSVRYAAATAAARTEIFGVNALRGKQQQLGSPKYLHWGVSFSGKENNLILKNKMAATGISLKIIYIFVLAVAHR